MRGGALVRPARERWRRTVQAPDQPRGGRKTSRATPRPGASRHVGLGPRTLVGIGTKGQAVDGGISAAVAPLPCAQPGQSSGQPWLGQSEGPSPPCSAGSSACATAAGRGSIESRAPTACTSASTAHAQEQWPSAWTNAATAASDATRSHATERGETPTRPECHVPQRRTTHVVEGRLQREASVTVEPALALVLGADSTVRAFVSRRSRSRESRSWGP